MSDLSQILDSIAETGKRMTGCGQELLRSVNTLREIVSGMREEPKEVPKPAQPAEEAEKSFSFIDVRKAFSAKSHAGYTEQVKQLIAKYGADKLSAVKEEDYASIMADLEAIV